MPICARCTGLLIGVLAGLLVPLTGLPGSVTAIALAILLTAPLLVDGLTQLAGLRRSTNPLRLATGVIAGLGLALAAHVLRFALTGS
jgi:uncharacterized membrane protein